jgi:hypothetical protein
LLAAEANKYMLQEGIPTTSQEKLKNPFYHNYSQ